MNQMLFVTKRNGKIELINLDKIHRVLNWAAKGLENISISQVALKSRIQFYNNIKTTIIHETIIKAAADLISENSPDYQYMAARLTIFHLRKKAFGQFNPPNLYDHVKNMIKLEKYDQHLLNDYPKQDFLIMNSFIKHRRDMNFSYAAVKQLEGKYLIQNRVTKKIYESAQFLYILISACLFSKYPNETRMKYIKNFYDAISTFKISLPTPIMAGLRTPTRQFSSCVLIESEDNLNSINATTSAIVKYVSQRAGIGINAGRIRALGSPIRNGDTLHTGCIPFYKHFQSAVKSCSQGGVRGGAATIFYPIWHFEIESLLVLKNNRGIEENRVRHMDYSVQLNKLMYQRLILGEHITLFSPSDVPNLYDSFFNNQEKFERLYIKYENDKTIRKKKVKASYLFSLMMQERTSTGRIYIQNVDHCNSHSAFNPKIAPIRQSNLCLEITLPTKALQDVHDKNGEISLCTLSAINLGSLNNLNDLSKLSNLIVRALDSVLDYQEYPILSAKKSALSRRTLGIGVINFAYYLAKNGVRYSDGSANNLTHRTFEAIQYHLLNASCVLAQEKGACHWFSHTNYYKGILPIDTYKKNVDEICNEPLHLDWELLRKKIKKYGLRNSTLSALMPSETSSQISNATNGIEPPRGLISIKASKDGMLRQVVPEYKRLKNNYELLWNIPNNTGYLQLASIMQKFVDQSISANTNYDPKLFPNNKIPMQQLILDLLTAYKLGLKTLYYQNTRDGASDHQTEDIQFSKNENCNHGACKI
ncbi:ribonucleoside-diphosphate reductase 1 alpha chain [Buchnera aphidicola str. Bp (Baizongia pistaciae)]|uniref:Ribonucleoside-diphosphate reductase subunit alpha n=1 Tax=Buchnera aphidicola subsp. Baizongia pistaciae (strain Bp) TaxID=224915 RepID=RIR1_BUCBP|nr:class 1a ribonucleoside-diphosphate reductase subunit alpha [Buchnera aphidicola]Q89AS4.1 RecName: Full=Ribonucleoside-diphosphate reductase subunit alpha; AltName: Full=Ribonucleotide reductase [Buchnera aphidicola str. Bp (Baizongia pistaciae)]AAO26901.1 ribonucleoside-diphosphate reductase 1 alpha chain [Buchnera aphidicola str. Bp (Baizongia pistaciae)]